MPYWTDPFLTVGALLIIAALLATIGLLSQWIRDTTLGRKEVRPAAAPPTPAGIADYTRHQPPARPGGVHTACRMQWWAGHPGAACPDCAPRLDAYRGPM